MNIQDKTIKLIDELKATCKNFGLGNDGHEYRIITQVFLYKFINDKFGYEAKRLNERLKKAEFWEIEYEKMSKEEKFELIDSLSADIPILYPEHLISYLWNQQTKGDFDIIFDNTMKEIADINLDIFATKTAENTKIPVFETLTNYITDVNKRPNFARALVDKLVNFSFEETFNEQYDFFATIFEYLVKDYNTAGGGKYAEYYTPHSIATIMARLLVGDTKNLRNVEVYDPSAGTGTLLIALSHQIGNDKCTIFSQDISQKSTKMLKLNLILNGLVSSLDHAIEGDTLIAPYHKSDDGKKLRQFDFIVSNPPFKTDFSENREKIAAMPVRFWGGVPRIPARKKNSMAIYTLFIQHVVNSLKPNGKAAIVVPTGFITAKSGIEGNVLREIVDRKLVYGCISMPSNVFATTGTNVSVIFLDNSRVHKDIILIDASNLGEDYKDGGYKRKRLRPYEIDKIVNSFMNKEEVEDFSVIVSHEEIKERNSSLAAGQYFEVKIDYVDITQKEFEQQMQAYTKELNDLFLESDKLQKEIIDQLGRVKYE